MLLRHNSAMQWRRPPCTADFLHCWLKDALACLITYAGSCEKALEAVRSEAGDHGVSDLDAALGNLVNTDLTASLRLTPEVLLLVHWFPWRSCLRVRRV